MINAIDARTKTNGVIANIKEQAIKDLMPQVNDAIEAGAEQGYSAVRIIIDDASTEVLPENTNTKLIEYKYNEQVIMAIVEELQQYGFSIINKNNLRFGLKYNTIDVSWEKEDAKG